MTKRPLKKTALDTTFIWILMINLTMVFIAYALAGKMIHLPFGLTATIGVFAYAAIFACTDIISEIYGYQISKKVVTISFVSVLLMLAYFQFALWFPAAHFWHEQKAFETVLDYTPRVALGGLISFVVSQHLDVWIFHKIREHTSSRHLWLRNNLSTAVSQGIDTTIFITIAFYGTFPVLPLILGQYLVKLTIAIIDTPIIYVIVFLIRRKRR